MADDPLITSLLFEPESASLDFKRDQYQFYGASDIEKSELVKDILAFANAWRRSDAYILVGIEEQAGSKATVVGISTHINDADIQQLVNSKTNAPVDFAYNSVELEGKQVGVIRIPVQDRPRFLRKSFGRLQENAVYVRRGSSTEIAKPDEIAKMGAASVASSSIPTLSLRFANSEKRTLLDSPLKLSGSYLDIDIETLPDYKETDPKVGGISFPTMRSVNRDYYRELAEFTVARNLCTTVEFAVNNDSESVAHDVRISLKVTGDEVVLLNEHSWPDRPERSSNLYVPMPQYRMPKASQITATRVDGPWHVDMRVEKVQPKTASFVIGHLYVGARATGAILFEGRISADNLPEPIAAELAILFASETRTVTLADIEELERKRFLSSAEYQRFLERSGKKGL